MNNMWNRYFDSIVVDVLVNFAFAMVTFLYLVLSFFLVSVERQWLITVSNNSDRRKKNIEHWSQSMGVILRDATIFSIKTNVDVHVWTHHALLFMLSIGKRPTVSGSAIISNQHLSTTTIQFSEWWCFSLFLWACCFLWNLQSSLFTSFNINSSASNNNNFPSLKSPYWLALDLYIFPVYKL